MERTLQVLDYAILVISGTDGVQAHTETLWQLLDRYQIPTFLFINKTDLAGTERDKLCQELKARLNESCLPLTTGTTRPGRKSPCALNRSWKNCWRQESSPNLLAQAIAQRRLFPLLFRLRSETGGSRRVSGGPGNLYPASQLSGRFQGPRYLKFPGLAGQPAQLAQNHRRQSETKNSADRQGQERRGLAGKSGSAADLPGPSSARRIWWRPAGSALSPVSPTPIRVRVWDRSPTPPCLCWNRCSPIRFCCPRAAIPRSPFPSSGSWRRRPHAASGLE